MIEFIFAIAVLIMSVVIHEVAHGYSASLLGDQTARYMGRLTLNPLRHLDPIGSLVVPAITYLLGGFIIGWARPVPYNPHNLRNQKYGPAIVGVAGPAANAFTALFFGLVIRFFGPVAPSAFVQIFSLVVFINLLLAVFNLIPIPPLDGSKALFALLPYRFDWIREITERYGLFLLLFFIFFLWRFFLPVVVVLFRLVTGAA